MIPASMFFLYGSRDHDFWDLLYVCNMRAYEVYLYHERGSNMKTVLVNDLKFILVSHEMYPFISCLLEFESVSVSVKIHWTSVNTATLNFFSGAILTDIQWISTEFQRPLMIEI